MILNSPYITGSLTVTGNATIAGNITVTGSLSGTATSASYAYTASSAINSFSASKAISSSYSATASFSNDFTVLGNLTVFGTQSVQYITSSQLNVSDNVITVNVASPGVRFGGLSVFDSGSLSSEATASLFWDSQNNHWIYQRESGSTYDGGMLISGPRNAAGLGNEQGTTACMLLVGQGGDHLTSSLVYHDSTRTCFYGTSLFISSSGNVGIGITSLTHKLQIYGGEIGQQVAFTKDAPSGVYGRLGQDSNGTFLSQNALYNGSNWNRDNTGGIPMALALHNGNGRYEFRIANNGSNPITWTNALVIDSASYVTTPGRIGIGTGCPISKLDISGCHTAGYGIVNIVSNDSALISLDSTTSSDVRIRFKQLGVDKWFAGMNTNDSWELRVADNTPRFVVTQDGRVGIGTSNPPSTQFAVVADWISGQATVKTYPITTGGASGYGIFDSNGTTRRAYLAANSEQVEVWAQQNTPMVLATNDIVRMRIDTGGRITTPYQPAFYAYGVSGASYGSGNYWIFPSTTFNRGSHYNTSNGIFTAPVAGVYEFSFSNLGGTGNTVYRYFLYINNSQTQQGPPLQLRIDKSGDTVGVQYGTNFTKTVIVSLSTNDTVRIYYSADSGEASYPTSNDSTNEYPTFSGKLVG
jgi:C1q domain